MWGLWFCVWNICILKICGIVKFDFLKRVFLIWDLKKQLGEIDRRFSIKKIQNKFIFSLFKKQFTYYIPWLETWKYNGRQRRYHVPNRSRNCKNFKFKEKSWKNLHNDWHTPLHAPEVYIGKGYSFLVDLWSIGITLFEFVAGGVPFGEDEEDPQNIY